MTRNQLCPTVMEADVSERLQLLISFGYLGGRFHGLQPQQKTLPTAGGALIERLVEAAGTRARGLAFSARTDAGVHALCNLATCFFPARDVDEVALLQALQKPRDDGLLQVRAQVVPKKVHARGCSAGKRYRFYVDDEWPPSGIGAEVRSSKRRDPQHGFYSWRVAPSLDGGSLRGAAADFCGQHDFSSFRAAGCTAASPIKILHFLRVRGPYPLGPGRRWVFELVGDAFVRKMVRNIVGALVEIGSGWRPIDDVPRLLAAKERKVAGLTAPARGLTLVKVGCTWPPGGSGLLPELARDIRDEDP